MSSSIPHAVNSSSQHRPLEIVFPVNMSEEGHLPFPHFFISSFISTPALRKTQVVSLSVYGIRKVLLRNHISADLILLSISLSTVQLLHSYRRTIPTNTFTILILVWIDMILFLVTSFIWQKVSVAMAILSFYTMCRMMIGRILIVMELLPFSPSLGKP